MRDIVKSSEINSTLERLKIFCVILPICATCKKIRDDEGYYHQIEEFISQYSDVIFTNGISPDCAKRLLP
jgi:hypothetical protein